MNIACLIRSGSFRRENVVVTCSFLTHPSGSFVGDTHWWCRLNLLNSVPQSCLDVVEVALGGTAPRSVE